MDIKEVKDLVDAKARQLNLQHWDFTVKVEPLENDVWASIALSSYTFAEITLDPKLLKQDYGFITKTITHELLHAVFHKLDTMMGRVGSELSASTRDMVRDLWAQELELVIEHLAGVIVPGVPGKFKED